MLAYDTFPYYLAGLFLVTGLLILVFDVRTYTMADMNKEKKVARALGWINLVFSVIVSVGNWALRQWWV